jgi:hypothetical protein
VARGWESKAVEEQQSMARTPSTQAGGVLDEAEAAAAQRLASLKLARARVLAGLQQACRPAHRAMLEAALADIDRDLSGAPSGPS